LLNDKARELAKIGVEVIQFDEPAFNVYMKEVTEWGIMALHRASEGLPCKTAVHICYGYGIKANIDWKESLGAEWRQYEAIFPALAGYLVSPKAHVLSVVEILSEGFGPSRAHQSHVEGDARRGETGLFLSVGEARCNG
jgi:methionine synthase II (cobalamin-independent)